MQCVEASGRSTSDQHCLKLGARPPSHEQCNQVNNFEFFLGEVYLMVYELEFSVMIRIFFISRARVRSGVLGFGLDAHNRAETVECAREKWNVYIKIR